MTHYSIEEWADFARGRVSDEIMAAAMQRHLDEGCTECAYILKMWRSVLEIASRESKFEAPDSAVRCAKALYNIAKPATCADTLLQVAHLVFSSRTQPLPEGIRSSGTATCHLLFEEGNWLLDLQVKAPQSEGGLMSVAGQILDRDQSERTFESSAVAVVHDDVEVASTTTNPFGEFHLEFQPGEDRLLTVRLDPNFVLVSPLPMSATGELRT